MFTQKTVMVLGAGASAPFGFPTGRTLKDEVADRLGAKDAVYRQLLGSPYMQAEMESFARSLAGAGQVSVDAFLERRDEFMELGKAAIAAVLLPYEDGENRAQAWVEKRSQVREEVKRGRRQNAEIEENWYEQLFGMLTEDAAGWRDLQGNQLSIVTFNYDRSLEDYLYNALQNSYGLSSQDAATAMGFITIEHVYGSLGLLPWQADPEGMEEQDRPVAYGGGPNVDVLQAAKSITILPERSQDPAKFAKARQLISEAHTLYFLGFGFHPTNLERLGLNEKTRQFEYRRIAATCWGLSAWAEGKIGNFHTIAQLHRNLNEPRFNNLFDERIDTFLHEHVTAHGWVRR